MEIQRTVETQADPATVFAYLSDFTHTEDWDAGTVSTTRIQGDGGVGTTYRNVSRFLGRETTLTYEVLAHEPERHLRLKGTNKTVDASDDMRFSALPGGGTRVTYTAGFRFKRWTRYVAPLLRPFLTKLGNDAEQGLNEHLGRLAR